MCKHSVNLSRMMMKRLVNLHFDARGVVSIEPPHASTVGAGSPTPGGRSRCGLPLSNGAPIC